MANTIINKKQVWLITGCSTGFGREIALAALASGAQVVVTARRPESVEDICQRFPEQSLAMALDVTNDEQIKSVVATVIARFGTLDVLVNNAGYGYVGAIEEGEDVAVRQLFDTNFFGALNLTKAVLPQMRKQRSGRILNNSSQAGLMANPGTGYYSASKYALEGLMEALGKEVEPFNIFVTSVQPGAFRTDWSGRSMQRASKSIEDYYAHVGSRLDMIADIDGKQPGDPVRAAKEFVMLANAEKPPSQLLLGAGVLATFREKLHAISMNLDEWESTTLASDFPAE
jgi:NAD(P)-dependent dehydrogenase (short-subunit alcohol dehydrogenase family)